MTRKFQTYEQAKVKAGDAVEGKDSGIHPYNTDQLATRPRMIFFGPSPRTPSQEADDLWPTRYYERWPSINGTTEQTILTESFMYSIDDPVLTFNICTTGVHLTSLFVANDFQDLEDNSSFILMDMKVRLRQIGEGSSSWSTAPQDFTSDDLRYLQTYYPADRSGLSRFLLQVREASVGAGKLNNEDGQKFSYREGQLYPEDYALLDWKSFQVQVPSGFVHNKPVRMDLIMNPNGITTTWGINKDTDPELLRSYVLSMSIFEEGGS